MPADRVQRHRQLELGVFLLLVIPGIVLGQLASVSQQPFVLTTVATMVHDVALSALVVFLVWSDGEALGSIGWTRRRAGREVLLGIGLYLPMLGLTLALTWLLRRIGPMPAGAPPALTPTTPAQVVLGCGLVIVVACAEETIFRGYLLLRLREVTGSTPAAVAIASFVFASFVFASGHLYEGVRGAIVVGMMGVVFALVYLWRRSLVAPIVMHFLQDFLGIVLLPALSMHR